MTCEMSGTSFLYDDGDEAGKERLLRLSYPISKQMHICRKHKSVDSCERKGVCAHSMRVLTCLRLG